MSADVHGQGFERFMAALTMLTGAAVATPLAPELRARLDAPLPRDKVKYRSQAGETLAYVDGHYVVEHLNEVFGFVWSFTCTRPVEVERYERETKKGRNIVIIYEVHGRLSAAGMVREDVGIGVCDMNVDNRASGVEKGRKEAVTDCLKRCAKGFGASFGLALYDKNRAAVGLSTTANALLGELDEQETGDAVNGWMNTNADAIGRLDEDERDVIRGAVVSRRRAFRAAAQAEASPPPAASSAPPAPPPDTRPPSGEHPAAARPTEPAALATYRQRIAAVPTTDTLVAAVLELAPTVAQHRDAAWAVARSRAAALGATPEFLQSAIGSARAVSTDPAAWRAAGAFLVALAGAHDRAAVDAAMKLHGAALAGLPDALRGKMRDALTSARAAADLPFVKRFEAAFRACRTIADVEALGDQAVRARAGEHLTAADLRALAAVQDEVATALEREVAA